MTIVLLVKWLQSLAKHRRTRATLLVLLQWFQHLLNYPAPPTYVRCRSVGRIPCWTSTSPTHRPTKVIAAAQCNLYSVLLRAWTYLATWRLLKLRKPAAATELLSAIRASVSLYVDLRNRLHSNACPCAMRVIPFNERGGSGRNRLRSCPGIVEVSPKSRILDASATAERAVVAKWNESLRFLVVILPQGLPHHRPLLALR